MRFDTSNPLGFGIIDIMKATDKNSTAGTIQFKTKLFNIGDWTVLKLDKDVSDKLTSRGLTMIEGTINGFGFQTALEPD